MKTDSKKQMKKGTLSWQKPDDDVEQRVFWTRCLLVEVASLCVGNWCSKYDFGSSAIAQFRRWTSRFPLLFRCNISFDHRWHRKLLWVWFIFDVDGDFVNLSNLALAWVVLEFPDETDPLATKRIQNAFNFHSSNSFIDLSASLQFQLNLWNWKFWMERKIANVRRCQNLIWVIINALRSQLFANVTRFFLI